MTEDNCSTKKKSSLVRSFCIAFSMFSSIPTPQFEWKEEDMKYMVLFFPWVGLVIGGLLYVFHLVADGLGMEAITAVLLGTAIPLLISGGIHVDGYMDTMDALHSWQSRERKLEILKDPHLGAFSVIMLLLYYLIYMGAYAQIAGWRAFALFCAVFYLSRILSGIGLVTFACAKKDGLLYTFSSQSHKRTVRGFLYLQLAVCGGFMLWLSLTAGLALLCVTALVLYRYRNKCKKEFGGITGDTAGYFVTICEGACAVTVAVCCVLQLI